MDANLTTDNSLTEWKEELDMDLIVHKAKKYIKKSEKGSINPVLKKKRKEALLTDAIKLLTKAIVFYKNNEIMPKYVSTMMVRYGAEKKLGENYGMQTLLELGEHFTLDKYYDFDNALYYYDLALKDFKLENKIQLCIVLDKILQVFEQRSVEMLVSFCENILQSYDNCLDFTYKDKIQRKLAENYFSLNDYQNSLHYYTLYLKSALEKNKPGLLISRLIFRKILCLLLLESFIEAEQEITKIENKYAEFQTIQTIKEIIFSIKNNNLESYTKTVNSFKKFNKNVQELDIFEKIKEKYFKKSLAKTL